MRATCFPECYPSARRFAKLRLSLPGSTSCPSSKPRYVVEQWSCSSWSPYCLFRDARRVPGGAFGALFALGAACYAIVSASVFAFESPFWLEPVRVVAMGNPVGFLLVCRALFDDDFKPSWLHALAWLVVGGHRDLRSVDRRPAVALDLQRIGTSL